jgi:hypothetical protein
MALLCIHMGAMEANGLRGHPYPASKHALRCGGN